VSFVHVSLHVAEDYISKYGTLFRERHGPPRH